MQSPTARYESRLEEILLEQGTVSEEDFDRVASEAAVRHEDLADALVVAGVVSLDDILAALSRVYDVPSVNPTVMAGDPMVLSLLPKEQAARLEALPFFLVENRLVVAVSDPEDYTKLNELAFITGKLIQPAVALGSQIREVLEQVYGPAELEKLEELEFESIGDGGDGGGEVESHSDLEVQEDERPIVRLVNLILLRAVQEHVTDIHLEPTRERLHVRFRIDGHLRRLPYQIPTLVSPAVISRIKVLARLDIAIQRRPQDGNIRLVYGDRKVDLRVSTFPSIHGEKVVIRILDQSRTQFSLRNIGMRDTLRERWQTLLRRREGMVVVTGPTGSGKTSTLFASLRYLVAPEVNIVTLEDPVEYEIEGVTQGQVNEKAGLTFASGLRSILRQDPDVILVGEIRDPETAQIAIQAALTGHLVLASMHTNDAPSAVVRLLDLEVPSYLVSAALIGVLAQRLVRRVCTHCQCQIELEQDEKVRFGPWLTRIGTTVVDAKGCRKCRGVGYNGRTGVHELMAVEPELRKLIAEEANLETLRRAAEVESYRPMWLSGIEKVEAGETTIRELARHVEMSSPPIGDVAEVGGGWSSPSPKVARLVEGGSSR